MKKRWITILTLILTVFLFCGMIPLNTRAEEEAPAETPTVEVSEETEETLPEEPVSVEEETETEEETPTEETAVDGSVFEEAVEEIAPVDVPAAAELTAEESLLLEGVRDSEELTAKVLNATRDYPQGVSVSVSSSKVKVVLNQVGTAGTVQLYRMAANEYYEGDTYSGMSESTGVKGTYLGSYLCDRLNEVEFNRYRNDGTDNLYCKYYLIQNGKIYGGPYYAGTI
ncbi:MAG: hypothetical protein IIZ47_00430, partial [Erysipelotrichaceae bacterium]|nr:hypothetical protein [Erysipelotrichaceae bacterium]